MKLTVSLPESYRLKQYDVLPSTNLEAKKFAESGESNLVVLALTQTSGRGRQNREWISPPGNLYFSLVLQPECKSFELAKFSFISSVAIGEALVSFAGNSKIEYKWPNDILLDGKKLAGILLESSFSGDKINWLIIGIGINIANFPKNVDFPATSLEAQKINVDIEKLLPRIIEKIDEYKKADFASIRKKWLERAYKKGEQIHIRTLNEEITGIFKNINEEGLIEIDINGILRKFSSGEVFFPEWRKNASGN